MVKLNELRPHVLVIEDEAPMRKFLRTFLTGARYRIVEAESGAQALSLAAESPPDIVILDLGLPDMDGQDVLQLLREWCKAPIVVLSARGQDKQKIKALDNGADDYLTKPFSTGELLARLRVALRKSTTSGSATDSPHFELGDLRVDFVSRQVVVGGKQVRLTRMEYRLLAVLIQHGGRVLTHQFILGEVWGVRDDLDPQSLRVLMASLRRKIEKTPAKPRYLLTELGVGYRLATDD